MIVVVRPAFAIDTAAALGPQLVAARAESEPVGWKALARATGHGARYLRRLHEEALAAARDARTQTLANGRASGKRR